MKAVTFPRLRRRLQMNNDSNVHELIDVEN